MKAWLATEVVGVGAGLGKMDVVVVPRPNGNCLTVKVTRDGRVWIDEEMDGQPSPEDELQNIEIDDALAGAVNTSFDTESGKLSHNTENLLIELVKKSLS